MTTPDLNSGGSMRFVFCMSLMVVMAIPFPLHADYYQYTDKEGVLRFTDELSDVPAGQRPHVTTHKSVDKEIGSKPKNEQPSSSEIEKILDEDLENTGDEEPSENTQEQGATDVGDGAADQPETRELTFDESAETDGLSDQYEEEIQSVESEDAEIYEQSVTGKSDVSNEDQPAIEEQFESEGANETDIEVEKTPVGRSWRVKAREKEKEIESRKVELNQRYKSIQDEKAQLGEPPAEDASSSEKNAYNERINKINEKIVQYQKDSLNLDKDVETFNSQISKKQRK
jgi:hypothetical protein